MENQEVLLGHCDEWRNLKVGDDVFCQAGAPGCGHCIYRITRIENGNIYAVVTENTIRVMEPWEVV